MTREEYIKTVVYNGHMINIGMDDNGQQYFLQYVEGDQLIEVGCGAYNENYQSYIEHLFGEPEQCVLYHTLDTCDQILAHGYCSKCSKNYLWQQARHIHTKRRKI